MGEPGRDALGCAHSVGAGSDNLGGERRILRLAPLTRRTWRRAAAVTVLTRLRLRRMAGSWTSAVIGRATGAPVRCLRPPYATVDAASADRARARGLRLVLWDVDSNDWRRPGAAAIAGRVLGRVRSGDVVLLHDGGGNRTQTVAALEQVLASLSARGFRFSALCRD